MATGTPNILLVMSDQHRADVMECAGGRGRPHTVAGRAGPRGRPLIRGCRVQGPLCMPARASFMTERYVRDHGTPIHELVRDPARQPDLRLGPAGGRGYHTALLGEGPPLPR